MTIKARAGASGYTTLATVAPAGDRWRLTVAPRSRRYRVTFAGDTTDRLVRVKPDLRVAQAGHLAGAPPAAALTGQTVFLFGWARRAAGTGEIGAARASGVVLLETAQGAITRLSGRRPFAGR